MAAFIGTQIGREQTSGPLASAASASFGSTNVDEIAGAQVAAAIARSSGMVIADNVTNLSDSLSVQVQLSGTDSEPYLDNPNAIATDAKTRGDITFHVVKSGETVGTVAKLYGVTSDTIRWANEIYGDLIAVGRRIKILPVSGLEHKVKRGDTPSSLADKYKTKASLIISFNDAEINGLKVGETIIIPGGKKPATPAFYGYPFGYTLTYGGNGYSFGYCTWHVANRRNAIGKPIPTGLGNAVTWYARAQAAGLPVSTKPKAGSVVWHKDSFSIAGGFGHVAFVEKINPDGSAYVSDMNYSSGWNRISYRTITPEEFSGYLFIN